MSNTAFYGKIAAASFAIGATMELFMIKTGFYSKVTQIEAERRIAAASNPPAPLLPIFAPPPPTSPPKPTA